MVITLHYISGKVVIIRDFKYIMFDNCGLKITIIKNDYTHEFYIYELTHFEIQP